MARETTSQSTRKGTQQNGLRNGSTTGTRQQNASSSRTQQNGSDRERSIDRSEERGVRTQGTGGLARRADSATGAVRNREEGRTPFSLMQRMAQDMEQLFEQFGFGRGLGLTQGLTQGLGERAVWNPQVEIEQVGDQIVVRADLPGVKKEDVQVDVSKDVLTIRGQRRETHEEHEGGFYRTERNYGQFYRAIPLPEGTNPDDVEAEYRDGVLEIAIPAPKQRAGKGTRVQVR